MENALNRDEYFAISHELECHHSLFYAMWNLGVPTFSKDIDTAAVRFDSEGELVEFIFNEDYWNGLTPYERLFVICHECLHVILHHGWRIRDVERINHEACNITLDIVVNHLLVNRFGFDRDQISMEKELCWVDTVFPEHTPLSDEAFEYYYNLLPRSSSGSTGLLGSGAPGSGGSGLKTPDEHSSFTTDAPDAIIDEISDIMSDEEKESIKDIIDKHYQESAEETAQGGLQAGTAGGGAWKFADVTKVPIKKKWETVIKKWSKKYDRQEFHEAEQWARLNRRFAMLSEDLMLPSEMEEEFEQEGKIDVWFFQDTSGSCSGYMNRFFKAAKSLDPKRFNIKMHCFDTRVFETTLESGKLYGFGGTAFQPIEAYIQKEMREKKVKYPKAVFVITDGYGSSVNPENSKVWYWFLTPGGSKHYIPKDSNVFLLQNYE